MHFFRCCVFFCVFQAHDFSSLLSFSPLPHLHLLPVSLFSSFLFSTSPLLSSPLLFSSLSLLCALVVFSSLLFSSLLFCFISLLLLSLLLPWSSRVCLLLCCCCRRFVLDRSGSRFVSMFAVIQATAALLLAALCASRARVAGHGMLLPLLMIA